MDRREMLEIINMERQRRTEQAEAEEEIEIVCEERRRRGPWWKLPRTRRGQKERENNIKMSR